MTKGLKIRLAIGIPVVILGTIGIILAVSASKRNKAIQDFITANSKGNTVTYVTTSGQTVTKPRSQVNITDLVNAGIKIVGLFGNKSGGASPSGEVLDYEPEFPMK